MEALAHVLMVFLILANLRLLGGTRLSVCIVQSRRRLRE